MSLTISEVAKDSIDKVLKLNYLGIMFTNFVLDFSEETIEALIDHAKKYSKTKGQDLEIRILGRLDDGKYTLKQIKEEKRKKAGVIFVVVNYFGLKNLDEIIMGNGNRPRTEQFYEINLIACYDPVLHHTAPPKLPSYS